MESGIKQNAVSFSAGMSNVPNDLLCSDDACSEVVGLTSENGEMKPIQMPRKYFMPESADDVLLYVHQLQKGKVYVYSYRRLITAGMYGVGLKYYLSDENKGTLEGDEEFPFVDRESLKITSVGNTLIVSTNKKVYYYLWNGQGYHNLGSKIPRPQVKFWLSDEINVQEESQVSDSVLYRQGNVWKITLDQNENWNNFVIGEFSKLQNDIRKDNGFFSPFFALAAVELYDGSYYMATSPVALFPNIDTRFCASIVSTASPIIVKTYMKGQHLMVTQSEDYVPWSDIVKNVTVFVTDGINPCDTTSDAVINYLGSSLGTEKTSTGFFGEQGTRYDFNPDGLSAEVYQLLLKKTDANVTREMTELRVFYRLCDIGMSPLIAKNTKDLTNPHILETLTTQIRLDTDGGEYFDHTSLSSSYIYSLNGRLHMANIQRSFFEGFTQFISKDNNDNHTVSVAIETSMGTKVVTNGNVIGSVGHYFYYPDPRATAVIIDEGDPSELTLKLQPHPGLNGVYCMFSPLSTLTSDATFPTTNLYDGEFEFLPNKVLVSEVDNPFVFRARGYNTVGKGEVMAIASNTAALSEGQFGQFPLYAFATDGIWALGTNATGTYSTVAPMSREVCNNPDSVTQTDSAVFFTSEKGLMVVAGSKVQCVSEQLNGKTETWGYTAGKWELVNGQNVFKPIVFKEFLSGCTIAYDYRDSLLWLLNKDYMWHYVFNIKSGTWAFVESNDDDPAYLRAVSDYPDTLLQDEDGWVSTLLGRLDQNDDVMYYTADITTRPMKFGNALTLKSIREMKHLAMMGSQAEVQIRLYASNDCRQWVEVRSLRGKPWKYYRVKYHLSRMLPTDRFIGTVFRVKETRDNKLR